MGENMFFLYVGGIEMNNETKHTPGPLQIIEAKTLSAGDRWHVYLADKSGRKIAALWGAQEEKTANAYLFAVAHELLGVLEMAYRALDDGDFIPQMEEIEAVIAKAKGIK